MIHIVTWNDDDFPTYDWTDFIKMFLKMYPPTRHCLWEVLFKSMCLLMLLAVSTATKRMLCSGSSSSDPRLAMIEYYKIKVENDSVEHCFQFQQEKLRARQICMG